MKKILLSIVAVAALATANAQVVFQSDFETWPLTNWNGVASYTPSIASQSTVAPQQGTSNAVLTNTSTSHRRFTTTGMSITGSTTYSIRFWAKGQGDVRSGLWDGLGTAGTNYAYNSYISLNSTVWTAYTQTMVAGATSSNAEFIMSVRNSVAPNHVQIDSLTITMGGTVAPTPIISIAAVQTPTNASTDSPYSGQIVKTGGIVTAISTNTGTPGFFMETSTGGPYSGIYVYSSSAASGLAVGDSVNLSATVSEFFGMTELTFPTAINKVSSGNPVPAAAVINPISGIEAEQYESVLVQVTGVQCTALPNSFQEWKVKKSTNTVTVGSDLYTYSPTLNNYYDITGVMMDSWQGGAAIHYYTLTPRVAADIVGSSVGINEISNMEAVSVYPNPSSSTVSFNLNGAVVKSVIVTDVLGRTMFSAAENINSVDVTSFENGIYNLVITTEGKVYQSKFVVKK